MCKKNKKKNRIYYIPASKVILSAILYSLIAGVILFALLFLVFSIKIVLNSFEILDSIDAAVTDTQLMQESADSNTDYKFNSLVRYLAFLHNETNEDYEDLVAFSNKYYPGAMTFFLDKDGTFLTEMPERLSKYNMDGPGFLQLVRDFGDLPFVLPDCKGYHYQMKNGNIAVSVINDKDNYLSNQIMSPLEAINSVMANNGIEHNEDNHAYMRDRKTGAIYTEEGYFEGGKLPEYLQDTIELPIVISNDNDQTKEDKTYILSTFFKNGRPYYSVTKTNEYLDVDITFYSYPLKELRADENITFTVEVTYIMLLIIFSLFVYYLRQYGWLHPEIIDYNPRINNRKTMISLTMTLLAISAAAYFSQTLFLLSIYALNDNDEFDAIKSAYEEKLETNERVSDYLKDDITAIDMILADSIGTHPNIVSKKNLEEMADIFGLQYIILYDTDGNETLSSNKIRDYSFPSNNEDPAYCFNTLKNGLGPVLTEMHESPLSGTMSIRSAINMYDTEENPTGYLEISIYPITVNTMNDADILNMVLKNMMLSNASNYYVVDPESNLVTYSPVNMSYVSLAQEAGFTEESMKPDFFGRLTLAGVPCYATNRTINNKLVYIIHPEEQVYLTRVPYTISVAILFFLNLLSMLWFLRRKRWNYSQVIYASKKQAEAVHKTGTDERTDDDEEEEEKSGRWVSLLEHLDSIKISWMYKTPEKKLSIAFMALIEIGALMLLVAFAYRLLANRNNSLLLRILSGRWAKGVNVFSLTANIIALLVTIVASAFIRWCLRMIGQISDARGETVTRLLRSAASYMAAIVFAYICLVNVGLNPSALVTSAGLVGVAIGIGARDLITDIIAGLFIIFESSFQVGDIIEVGGYEGTVHEIGIRTTKVTGWDLNIKTINNRNMSNVINMSVKKQISIFYFRVPYTVSEETLRAILEKELKDFKTKYPELITVPYLSISRASLSGMMECRIVSEIPEQTRAVVEKRMIEEVERILMENNIPAIFETKPKESTHAKTPKNNPDF